MTEIILLSFGIISLLGAIAALVRPYFPAAIPAFLGLCLLHWSRFIALPDSTFYFWGIATMLLFGIHYLSRSKDMENDFTCNLYLTVGAIAGMLLGMAVGASFMILGDIIGTIIGVVAYVNTPKGRSSKFRSSIFIHYFCTKGLQVIVTIAMTGIALEGFILN